MFIVFINFPPIKPGKESDFKEWFAQSNKDFAPFNGFIRRRLLKPEQGGNYSAIVEFESREAFMAMHTSPAHDEAGKKVVPLLEGSPAPHFYEVVIGG
ncbi:MAG: antibiotic biosynthesis monooxygenase [Syntrophorhabdaceae bacterium]|nr:antibiotic biosynthesis monooxygenase [Syntrophorhabdaceae bacterium]